MDIDCVDAGGIKNDEAMMAYRRSMPHALHVHSVGHMVRSIDNRLGRNTRNTIRRLRVFGHGTPGGQGLGQSQYMFGPKSRSYLTIRMAGNHLQYESVLAGLCGKFAPGGWVELHGCEVGQGEAGKNLTKALARLWGVNVAAGTVIQQTDAGFETRYIVAQPGGHVMEHTGNYVFTPTERAMMETGTSILVTWLVHPFTGMVYTMARMVQVAGQR